MTSYLSLKLSYALPGLLFLSFFAAPSAGRAETVEQIVAVVNDKVITETDIQKFTEKIKSKGMVDDLVTENPQELLKDRKKLVDTLITERILDSEVKHQSLEVTAERIEQEVRTIASKNHMNRTQLKAALKEQGMDFADYQDFLKTRIERQSLIDKVVTSHIRISDEEIAAHYLQTHSTSGKESFEYTLAHIMFLPKGGDVEAAKERARGVEMRLKEGLAFDQAAQQFSEDPNFSAGGILGTFRSGEMSKEIEAGVKGLPINGISALVRTAAGFHIIKVLNKKLVSDPEFEKSREQVRGVLYQEAFKKQFAFWLDQKRREAFIRIN